jgi:2-polyprenyl-3-methyl-5-hydroxy-6-metoxy-1,4-benzoquinol methylase
MFDTTYEVVEFIKDSEDVIVDSNRYLAKRGKHSIWIPKLGMKFPFHWNGHFIEYKDVEKGQHWDKIKNYEFGGLDSIEDSIFNIVEEKHIFSKLYDKGFSPSVGNVFFIKNLITDFFYNSKHCDSMGAYGFYMENAENYNSRKFDKDSFSKEFIDSGILECSDTALNDLCLNGRNNYINGYVVDIRRSIQDAIHLKANGKEINNEVDEILNVSRQTSKKLKEKIFELTQFPYKSRKEQYQSYYIGNEFVGGSRNIPYRFDKFGIDNDLTGKTILDLGCNLGGVSQECYRRGARKIVGIDFNKDYIECARDLARFNGQQINFLKMDLIKPGVVESFIAEYFNNEVDIVFCLAIDKHIGLNRAFQILDSFKPKIVYWEGSAAKSENTFHVIETNKELNKRFNVTKLGFTEDRNKRFIWRANAK